MRLVKRIGIGLLVIFIAIQFFQPTRNIGSQNLSSEFRSIYNVPVNVKTVLENACYDCHSNNSNYPWYTYVQPIGWIMANHIKDGKKELNFSEFGEYSNRKKQSKLKSIMSQIRDGSMPLSSYVLMHKNARMNNEEKAVVINFMQDITDSLDKQNP